MSSEVAALSDIDYVGDDTVDEQEHGMDEEYASIMAGWPDTEKKEDTTELLKVARLALDEYGKKHIEAKTALKDPLFKSMCHRLLRVADRRANGVNTKVSPKTRNQLWYVCKSLSRVDENDSLVEALLKDDGQPTKAVSKQKPINGKPVLSSIPKEVGQELAEVEEEPLPDWVLNNSDLYPDLVMKDKQYAIAWRGQLIRPLIDLQNSSQTDSDIYKQLQFMADLIGEILYSKYEVDPKKIGIKDPNFTRALKKALRDNPKYKPFKDFLDEVKRLVRTGNRPNSRF